MEEMKMKFNDKMQSFDTRAKSALLSVEKYNGNV